MMKKVSRFTVSSHWQILLQDMKLVVHDVLDAARLPHDLFQQPNQLLLPDEYFRLWLSMEQLVNKNTQQRLPLPLMVGQTMSTECFDAPIFASLCSPNFNVALKRLSYYKPLIGPMRLHIQQTPVFTGLSVAFYNCEKLVPDVIQIVEMVFFTQLLRIATRESIKPLSVVLPHLPNEHLSAYQRFFGCELAEGRTVEIRFAAADAEKPFLTHNAGMWDFFEESLNRKMMVIKTESSSTAVKVRTELLKSLPAGETRLENVADSLAMSKRTLQRKLAAEGVLYQELLDSVRLELADHYLKKSQLPLSEIAFLLGYHETNSFYRAYNAWKGVTPLAFREQ